jgi:hypothetical protein
VRKVIHSHFDDFTIVGPPGEAQQDMRDLLRIFPGHDLGETRRLLGIVLERNQATGSIKLTQPELIQDILELLGLQQATRQETPLPAGTLCEIGTASTLDVDAMCLYMTVLVKLNYMAQTRPDIVFAVNGLARFQQRATTVHMQLCKHMLPVISLEPACMV